MSSQSSVLKLDIDHDYSLVHLYVQRTEMLLNWLGVEYSEIHYQPSHHHNIHLWVLLREEMPLSLAYLYQSLLGDDSKRSRFNEMRLASKHAQEFNILFSKKRERVIYL